MDLGKHVVDKSLLDKNGRRAGKVDDILLDVREPDAEDRCPEPEVIAIISGPGALTADAPPWVRWPVRVLYHLLGIACVRPVMVPWRDVSAIDVVVHVDVDRDETGLTVLANAVARRYIERLPGA